MFLAATPIAASLAPYVSDFDGALPAATYRPDVFAIPPPENDAPNHTLEEAMKHSSAGR